VLFIIVLLLNYDDFINIHSLSADGYCFYKDGAADLWDGIFFFNCAAVTDINCFIEGWIGEGMVRIVGGGWFLAGQGSGGRVGLVKYINGK
jgi:hypothetical protein